MTMPSWLRETLKVWGQYLFLGLLALPGAVFYERLLSLGWGQAAAAFASLLFAALSAVAWWVVAASAHRNIYGDSLEAAYERMEASFVRESVDVYAAAYSAALQKIRSEGEGRPEDFAEEFRKKRVGERP